MASQSDLVNRKSTFRCGRTDSVIITAHAWYGDTIGGSFRLASEAAVFLAKKGHRVSYVCCSKDVDRVVCQKEANIDLWRYPPPRRGRISPLNLWYHVKQTKRVVEQIIEDGRQVFLNGHSPLQYRGALAALAGRSTLAASCFSVHSPFDEELRSHETNGHVPLKTRLAAAVARRIDRQNIARSDVVQTYSSFTRDVLCSKFGRRYEKKMTVTPGWVETSQFSPVADRIRLRDELSPEWNTADPVFFTVRRLEPRMGLDTLVNAAGRLRKTGKAFRVLIGGDGSQKEPLERLAREQGLEDVVRLLGRVPEEDLPKCYAAANCFVLPTRALECFGLIVIESFATGTPVIASRAGAIPEIAGRQGEDWLFEPGNEVQLAEKMGEFLDGHLEPSVDLRGVAEEYDRPRVLERWMEECLTGLTG